MTLRIPPRASLRALPAAALALMALSAQAETTITSMVAKGSYALDGGTTTSLIASYPDTDRPDVLEFPGSMETGSSAGLHSYGNLFGVFGSRSSGTGIYRVDGSFRVQLDITNTTASAANARFSFFITPGMLTNDVGGIGNGGFAPLAAFAATDAPASSVLATGGTLGAGQFVEAGIGFDLQKNGTSLWNSQALLRTDASGTSFASSGAALYTGSGAYRTIAGGAFEVDLGVLNVGETVHLSYDIVTLARGNAAAGSEPIVVPEQTIVVPDQFFDPCGECGGLVSLIPGTTIVVPEHTILPAPSGSQASSGDPFGISFGGLPVAAQGFPVAGLPPGLDQGYNVTFTAAVPEPSSYALMALGLGVIGFLQRRRRAPR